MIEKKDLLQRRKHHLSFSFKERERERVCVCLRAKEREEYGLDLSPSAKPIN